MGRGRLGAARPPTPPGWAARVSQIGGGRKTQRRGLRQLFTKRNGMGRFSSASPLSAALLRREPRAGGEGREPGVASPPRRPRRAPLRLFPALQPHPALTTSCRGDGILWRRRREAPGIGPGPPPALPPAGGRALGYRCAVTVLRDRSFVWPSSHSDLEKDSHSVPSFLAECQKSPRLDRNNMVL